MEAGNRTSARPGTLLLAVAALLVASLFAALPARAAEGVTRSMHGVNYTLPSDWGELSVPEELLEGTGLEQLVAFAREDGFFVAAALPGSLSMTDLASTQDEVADLAAEIAGVEYLPGVVGLPIEVGAAEEQGFTTVTAYTDDIEINGVVYGMTLKLFAVTSSEFEGVVGMLSFLPASGTVTEGFAQSFPVLEGDRTVEVAGVPYTVPAGSTLAQGSVFGIGFTLAWLDQAVFAAVDLPAAGMDEVALGDLQQAADSLSESVLQDSQVSGALQSFWAGAYQFAGVATLGVELTADPMGTGTWYSAAMLNFASDGLALAAIAEPLGTGYAQQVLGVAASGSADASEEVLPAADPGFTVGLAA